MVRKGEGRLNLADIEAKVDYRLCRSDEDYANQARTFADESVDFCLVDGAVRDQCAFLMLPKIRGGGYGCRQRPLVSAQ